MESYRGFLGQGWSFPPVFDSNSGQVSMSAAEDNIRQSVWTILSTSPGERVMRPDFGCDLKSLMFEESDQGLKRDIVSMVSKSLLVYEPRIQVDFVEAIEDEEDPGKILIHIDYTIKTTNSRKNIVYPFYLHEASYL